MSQTTKSYNIQLAHGLVDKHCKVNCVFEDCNSLPNLVTRDVVSHAWSLKTKHVCDSSVSVQRLRKCTMVMIRICQHLHLAKCFYTIGKKVTSKGGSEPPPKEAATSPVRKQLQSSTTVKIQPNNPKRVGSASHTRYELYKGATTVGEARDGSMQSMDLMLDIDKGFAKKRSA